MSLVTYAIAFGVVAAILGWLYRGRRGRHNDAAWLPSELRTATLYSSEAHYRLTDPIKLKGKADRIYRRRDGILVAIEFKSRFTARAFKNDVIQLSAYAWAVSRTVGRDVARHGYIVTVHPKTRTKQAIKVPLISEREIITLYKRYADVRSSVVQAAKTTHKKLCQTCAYNDVCQQP